MFRIVCDPSSGSTGLCLTEITRSGSQMFVVCLVGVWQRNFEPVVCVCVYGTTGWQIFKFWIANWKTKDSVPNNNKHSLNSICP